MNRPALVAIWITAISIAAAWPWLFSNRYFVHLGIQVGIMGTMALALNLTLRIGQLSIVHVAFMGLGAYVSAILAMRLGVPVFLAALLSGLLVTMIALLFGSMFLRVKGIYFVLLTFAAAQVINLTFQNWTGLFGGNSGMYGVPKLSMAGTRITDLRIYYEIALAMTLATLAVVTAVYRSEIGTVVDSVDEDEGLSQSLGLDAHAYRRAIFALSAFLASLAGAFYAHYVGFLAPEAFSFHTIIGMILINVVGGIQSPLGILLAAVVSVVLPEALRDAERYRDLVYGLILIGFLLFLPDGFGGLFRRKKLRSESPS